MIKNLSQLKKTLKPGVSFTITAHWQHECVGEHRLVTKANTQGFYSVIPDAPQSRTSQANNGRGSWLGWSKASFWLFRKDVCAIYSSGTDKTDKNLIMAFRVTGKVA